VSVEEKRSPPYKTARPGVLSKKKSSPTSTRDKGEDSSQKLFRSLPAAQNIGASRITALVRVQRGPREGVQQIIRTLPISHPFDAEKN